MSSVEKQLAKLEKEIERLRKAKVEPPPREPVEFCQKILRFTPTAYQKNFLEDTSRRILLCWSRQSGKSHTIAAKAIWYSLNHPKTLSLIVAPSLRQSLILSDKIEDHLANLTTKQRKAWIQKQQRTQILFKNGSRIIALPCSENLLRGYTADIIICFPGYVKVLLANGEEIPISQVKMGQRVLSYNMAEGKLEPKKVLKVHRNLLGNRSLVRIIHEHGFLDCTLDHKILTVENGYIPAKDLKAGFRIHYFKEKTKFAEYLYEAIQQTAVQTETIIHPVSVYSGRSSGRLFDSKAKNSNQKLPYFSNSFIETSRVKNMLTRVLEDLPQQEMEREIVYDLEVEDNHNYFAERVLVSNCDEANFFQHDEDIFYSILMPMLATTDGTLIVSSTPWNKDSVFYRFYNDPTFSKHIVTWQDAVEAGLMKKDFITQMQSLLPAERFQREFEAQFVEDIDAWLPQSLIVKCIESSLEPYEFEDAPSGNFFVGVDFGKHQDHSVVAIVRKDEDGLRLVHIHRFPLETRYASVIGYVKSLCDRWRSVWTVYVDVTGVGEYICEDMRNSGISHVTGITFTVKTKEEMATILKEKMRQGEFKIPYVPVRRMADIDLVSELNIEKFELAPSGHIKFSHPESTHDDVFWAVCLAVYAAVQSKTRGIVDLGRIFKKIRKLDFRKKG